MLQSVSYQVQPTNCTRVSSLLMGYVTEGEFIRFNQPTTKNMRQNQVLSKVGRYTNCQKAAGSNMCNITGELLFNGCCHISDGHTLYNW
jgi:hypothetical protein